MTTSKNLIRREVFVALFLCLHFAILNAAQFAADLRGRFCENRRNPCCGGRQDECSAPILGTLCYCDDFCDRIRNEDCCPDFWTLCRNVTPPPPSEIIQGCKRDGNFYSVGAVVKDNCNECLCQNLNNGTEFLCETHQCLVDEQLLDQLNRNYRSLGWKAGNYSTFWGRKYDESLLHRTGTLHSRKQVLQMQPIKNVIDVQKIPSSFDARVQWPGLISPPRDQGWCGASWAFSTVSVASDRFAIMTHGNDHTLLSPQHLLNCNSRSQRGCEGGHLTRAWMFIRKFGLVPEKCYPLEGNQSECRVPKSKKAMTASCPRLSPFGSEKEELHRVGPVYRIATEQGIQFEILRSGPVQAIMKVTRDFFSYSKGIYKCSVSSSDRSGYHAVRIIGWGEDTQYNPPLKYWIASNSWGEWWGENGFFRIRRGTNECLIEDFVIAAWAKIDNFNTIYNTGKWSQNNIIV